MSIYGDIILDHYNSPKNNQMVKNKTHMAHVDNHFCGDSLDMSARIENGKVLDIGFTGEGCAVSIAAASLLTEYVKGKKISDLNTIDPKFMVGLVHIELSPNRLKCALLPWEALKKIINSL